VSANTIYCDIGLNFGGNNWYSVVPDISPANPLTSGSLPLRGREPVGKAVPRNQRTTGSGIGTGTSPEVMR
jgi:hypothetical protein